MRTCVSPTPPSLSRRLHATVPQIRLKTKGLKHPALPVARSLRRGACGHAAARRAPRTVLRYGRRETAWHHQQTPDRLRCIRSVGGRSCISICARGRAGLASFESVSSCPPCSPVLCWPVISTLRLAAALSLTPMRIAPPPRDGADAKSQKLSTETVHSSRGVCRLRSDTRMTAHRLWQQQFTSFSTSSSALRGGRGQDRTSVRAVRKPVISRVGPAGDPRVYDADRRPCMLGHSLSLSAGAMQGYGHGAHTV